MSTDLQNLLDHITTAEEEYAAALAEEQASCSHTVLLEAPWEPSRSGMFAPMQALRICDDCGVEEEGPSFRVLQGRAYRVARNGPDGLYASRKRGGPHRVSTTDEGRAHE